VSKVCDYCKGEGIIYLVTESEWGPIYGAAIPCECQEVQRGS